MLEKTISLLNDNSLDAAHLLAVYDKYCSLTEILNIENTFKESIENKIKERAINEDLSLNESYRYLSPTSKSAQDILRAYSETLDTHKTSHAENSLINAISESTKQKSIKPFHDLIMSNKREAVCEAIICKESFWKKIDEMDGLPRLQFNILDQTIELSKSLGNGNTKCSELLIRMKIFLESKTTPQIEKSLMNRLRVLTDRTNKIVSKLGINID